MECITDICQKNMPKLENPGYNEIGYGSSKPYKTMSYNTGFNSLDKSEHRQQAHSVLEEIFLSR
jgi:hypothetical protein